MDLDKLRQEIDEIDTQMCDLFARRMQVVSGIGKYKKENNLPVYHPTFLIRPEHIMVEGTKNTPNIFKAKYESGTFLGERSEMTFLAENNTIIEVSEDSSEIRETGKEYTLSVLPSNVVILED